MAPQALRHVRSEAAPPRAAGILPAMAKPVKRKVPGGETGGRATPRAGSGSAARSDAASRPRPTASARYTPPAPARLKMGQSGRWVPIDPRACREPMQVRANVISRGTVGERLQVLSLVAAKQENALTQIGLANPLCTPAQYRQTLADIVDLTGGDADRYYQQIPADWVPEPSPREPKPEEVYSWKA